MSRISPLLFLLLAALALPAASNDLVLNAGQGTLQISGSQIPPNSSSDLVPNPANSVTVLREPAATATVWLYSNDVSSLNCPMENGSILHLKNAGTEYLTVSFDGQYLTVTNTTNPSQGTFVPISPAYYGYKSYELNGYSPGTDFTVTSPTLPVCGTSFAGQQFLWIYPGTPPTTILQQPTTTGDGGDGGDGPPVPISGNSLKLYAPPDAKFTCSPQNASLEGVTARRLEKHRVATPLPLWDTFMFLDQVSNWRITAYPQRLEISPSFWGNNLNFSVPAKFKFACGTDSGGNYLNVQVLDDKGKYKDVSRPQQFVLDWSPGLFSSRRFVPVTCPYDGTPGQPQFGCLLKIVTKKKTK